MKTFGRVLVGFDGSDDSLKALEYAAYEVKATGAKLVLVNVVDDTVLNTAWGIVYDPDDMLSAANEILDVGVEAAAQLGVTEDQIVRHVALGYPAAALANMSEEADLIVLGRRSVPGAERMFVGSTVTGLATTSRCPVILMSDDSMITARDEHHVIGVGISNAGRGSVSLDWGARRALQFGADLVLYSVCQAPTGRIFSTRSVTDEQRERMVATVQDRTDRIAEVLVERYSGLSVTTKVPFGHPVDLLVEASDDLDLLVVEVKSTFPATSVSGVVRGIMTHARCPVALIRAV